jgi:hypothetical protein
VIFSWMFKLLVPENADEMIVTTALANGCAVR